MIDPGWEFYATDIRTGRIIEELPLVEFSGGRRLTGDGRMQAQMPLSGIGSAPWRQQLLDCTVPGRYSVVARRYGLVMGEWVIWTRTRRDDFSPVTLGGEELFSVLKRRVTQNWSWTQVEQLTIGRDLAAYGFANGSAPITITIPAIAPSGQKRDRVYTVAQGDIATRLRELGAVQNGFEFAITTDWAAVVNGTQSVTRTLSFFYPQAGIEQPVVLERAGRGPDAGGNITTLEYDEDAALLASTTYAVGGQVNQVTVMGTYSGTELTNAGYPLYERTGSWTDVIEQATINQYARNLYDESQRSQVAWRITALADALPRLGEISLGDRVTLAVEPSINFPNGFYGQVRITGWTMRQVNNGPETVDLECDSVGAPVSKVGHNDRTVNEQLRYLSARVRTLEVL